MSRDLTVLATGTRFSEFPCSASQERLGEAFRAVAAPEVDKAAVLGLSY